MNIIVCKCCVYVLHYFFYNIISFIGCWIKLTFVLCIAINDDILVSFTSSPCLSMSWSVNFRNQSDSTGLSILDEWFYVILSVNTSDWSILRKFRYCVNLHWETVFITDMPMQNVHFVKHKPIDHLFNNFHWLEMSWGIDHKTSPQIIWLIVNKNGNSSNYQLSGKIISSKSFLEKLWESLESSQKSDIIISSQLPVIAFSDNEWIFFLWNICSDHLIGVFYNNCQCDVRHWLLRTFKDLSQVNVNDFLDDHIWWRWDFVINFTGWYDQRSRRWIGLNTFW